MSNQERNELSYPDHIATPYRDVVLDDVLNGETEEFTEDELERLGIGFERTARRALQGPSELDAIQGFEIIQHENSRNHYTFIHQRAVSEKDPNPEVFERVNPRHEGSIITGEVMVGPKLEEGFEGEEIVLYSAERIEA